MPQNFIVPQRDQLMLLPVDVRDWLGEDDIVWHVLDVVDQLDLTPFRRRYRANGQGAAAFDPAMMLALVIYAHAVGVQSSRKIELACTRDAGFKVVTGQLVPDHSTITRFVKTHQVAIVGLFAEVLRLCRAAGMARVGVIAVDGTKIAANASWSKSYTAAALAHQLAEEQQAFEALAAELLGVHLAADEAEDAEHGDDRGDELPPRLRGRAERIARIKAAQADLAGREEQAREAMRAEQQAKQADFDARKAAGVARGPRPKDEVNLVQGKARQAMRPRASTTDPDSRRMKDKTGFVQGYNAQAAVTADQIIVAVKVTQTATDHHLLPEMLDLTTDTLTAAGVVEPIEVVLADAGYANEATFRAAEQLGVTLLAPLRKDDVVKRENDPAAGRELSRLPATAAAQQRLRTEQGAALYAQRGQTVEPVFGQLKDRRGLRRFSRRGLANVNAELTLAAIVHNIVKLHRGAAPRLA